MIDEKFLNYVIEILGETNTGLSGSEIVRYFNEYAVKYDKEIPFDTTEKQKDFPNKRTGLLENLKVFTDDKQFIIIKELCELYRFKDNEEVKELKDILFQKYGNYYLEVESINTKLTEETKHFLSEYPDSLELYNKALNVYKIEQFNRNCLDNLRLSLELLLKNIFSNVKSLENQKVNLGSFFKEKSISPELRNMFNTLIDYYATYQNTYVKHNDNVNEDEIDAIFDLTSILLRFIIKNNN